MLHTRRSNLFRWARELPTNATIKGDGFVALRHGLVHHGAITVAFDVRVEALKRIAPRDVAHLLGCDFPSVEALERFLGPFGILVGGEVDKSVSEASETAEVHGRIEKVVATLEALLVQELEQHVACVG